MKRLLGFDRRHSVPYLFFYGSRNPRRGTGLLVASECPLRMGAERRHEARSGMRLWGGAGLADARLDARQGFPFGKAGEPLKVSPVRIAARAAGVQCATDDAADAGVRFEE